ncbi:MAG: phosphonoacetaldehyde reductase [Candidatus Izemoplasmatales bacterium]|nr:phosphonoacetaldehyde reductase [Candidatus Izemoplasmatales bacterium]
MNQDIRNNINELGNLLNELKISKFLLVCDSSFEYLKIVDYVKTFSDRYVLFNQFTSNPNEDDAIKGVNLFNSNKFDAIVAIGGGSTIDVAKYIKLHSEKHPHLIVVPTTAGTGSESTKHIVVYKNGVKQSIANDFVIPNYVILDAQILETLPPYQKYCTVMDALFQGIESYWSINATPQSRVLASNAIKLITNNINDYLTKGIDRRFEVDCNVMVGANLAGQAINITSTTAGHAMSYKLSSMMNIPHGHAVALCMFAIWDFCIPYVEKHHLFDVKKTMLEIASICGYKNLIDFRNYLHSIIFTYAELRTLKSENIEEDIKILVDNVKPERLKNNPIQFTKDELREIYYKILRS